MGDAGVVAEAVAVGWGVGVRVEVGCGVGVGLERGVDVAVGWGVGVLVGDAGAVAVAVGDAGGMSVKLIPATWQPGGMSCTKCDCGIHPQPGGTEAGSSVTS